MTNRSNVDAQVRGFYFAASGNDDFDGKTIERPKETIQAAIDETQLLIPIPAFGDIATVTAAQGGIFNAGFVLPESVQFEGESTVLNLSAAVAVTLDSFLNCSLTSVTNSANSGISFKIDGQDSTGLNVLANRVFGDTATGLSITGVCDNIFVTISQFTVTGTGSTAIKIESASVSPIDINCNTAALEGTDTTFMDYDPVNATDMCVVNVSAITNGGSGTIGFIVRNGILIAANCLIAAETAIHVLAGAEMTLTNGCIDGDIIVDLGGILNVTAVHQISGTITNNGTINGNIDGVPFGTYRQKHEEQVVLTGFSLNTQAPVATDTLLQIEFGAAQFGPTDPVQISALGAVTINQADQYNVKIVLQYGRSGAAGSSAIVFFRILVDAVQFGESRYAQLDNPNQAFPVQFSIPMDLLVTQVLTMEFWRDSSGFNAGELMPRVPALGGTNTAPSASIILTRNRLVQPV